MKKVVVHRKIDKYYSQEDLADFVIYCRDLYINMLYIKRYYEHDFNSTSENLISIDAHIEMFWRTFKQLIKVVNSPTRYENLFNKNKKTKEIFEELYHKFSNLNDFHLEQTINGEIEDLFNEKYYEKMKKFSDILFTQEEIIALTTQKIWHKHIAKSADEIQSDKYCCLVKVLSDWRCENRSPALDEYMKSRYAMSVSLITDFKSRFFECPLSTQTVGIIYASNKIIAGSYKDAFLEEFIDERCPLQHQYYSSIRKTGSDNNHTIYSYASRIATPKSVLFIHNTLDTYNEVIIDKRESKPIAVFYVKQSDELSVFDFKKAKRTAEKMAEKFNLPLIELESKNLFKDIDENDININSL